MIRIMCDIPGIVCKQYESAHNSKFKTLKEFEEFLYRPDPIGGVHDYIVYSGAVKRRYTFTEERKWERVLHPRGTKRKVKPTTPVLEVAKEVKLVEFWSTLNGYWIPSAFTYKVLMEHYEAKKIVTHHHRVTFTDGTVEYYRTNTSDYTLVKSDTDPSKPTSAEVNVISSTPAEKVVSTVEFFSEYFDVWFSSAHTYETLRYQLDNKQGLAHKHRVTFTDGSVEYYDKQPAGVTVTVSPVPVSVPWHVAYLDIVNNGAKYTCVYKLDPVFGRFELEAEEGKVKFRNSVGNLTSFKFTESAVEADYYKKETK